MGRMDESISLNADIRRRQSTLLLAAIFRFRELVMGLLPMLSYFIFTSTSLHRFVLSHSNCILYVDRHPETDWGSLASYCKELAKKKIFIVIFVKRGEKVCLSLSTKPTVTEKHCLATLS
jgi:hypothetical protein